MEFIYNYTNLCRDKIDRTMYIIFLWSPVMFSYVRSFTFVRRCYFMYMNGKYFFALSHTKQTLNFMCMYEYNKDNFQGLTRSFVPYKKKQSKCSFIRRHYLFNLCTSIIGQQCKKKLSYDGVRWRAYLLHSIRSIGTLLFATHCTGFNSSCALFRWQM